MGIFEKVFNRPTIKQTQGYFKLLDGYVPVFNSWRGSVYESELCRTAVDAIARNCMKLQITTQGSAKRSLQTKLKYAPNDFQTWSQFLYRTSTILNVTNTAFIVPIIGDVGETVGLYPIAPSSWEVVQVDGKPWIRFTFSNQMKTAVELNRVGILTRYQYRNDLFGETNEAMSDTLNLIKIQRQGIEESAKNAATYRFMATLKNFSKPDDLKKEREIFNEHAFGSGGGGALLFPNSYTDIKQINQQTFAVDDKQMHLIQENVYNYFGVNEDVIQNKAYGDAWSAFYEGCIEVFAIQLSEVLTRMIFTEREKSQNNAVFFTSNRLQYMSNADKLNVSTQLLDRGIITINQALEMWQLPTIGEDGDVRIIRGEYYNADDKVADDDPSESEETDD